MDKDKSKNWGGAGRGQGRKAQWYGQTVVMRVPTDWIEGIKQCMAEGRAPDFSVHKHDNVPNQVDKVQKQDYSPELIQEALALYAQGLNGGKVWEALKSKGFSSLPSKPNMKRTLESWKAKYGTHREG